MNYITTQSRNVRTAAETFQSWAGSEPDKRLEQAPTIKGFSATESASGRWTYETIIEWEADDGREGERFIRLTSDYALDWDEFMEALAEAGRDLMRKYEASFGGPIDPEAASFGLVDILGIYKSF